MARGALFFIHKKLTVAIGVALAVAGLAVFGGMLAHSASAADCDNNAIMHCGTGSASNFISRVKSNNSGNGHHDLKAVYAHYGLEPADYDKFVKYARPGTAYKDGRVVVDGQVVARGGKSIGRLASYQGSGYFKQSIGSNTYYGNTNAKAFKSNSIPVMVLFNSRGVMQFAVLTSCGNPEFGPPVKPTYSCNLLKKQAVSGKKNTYSFTTSASAGNNAKIAKLVYDFGDGHKATTTSPSAPVQHTFSQPGSYTVKVTVYVHLPGNQTTTVTSADCATIIKVTPPPTPFYGCVELTGAIIDQSKHSYSFTATARSGNGATFENADFNFGDGNSANGVQPNGDQATTQHTYAAAGTYKVTATLHFNAGSTPETASCSVTATPTTIECKPGVPAGRPMCHPCQYNNSLPSNSPECKPPVTPVSTPPTPTQLVNTGPGAVVGVFAGVTAAGFFLFRWRLRRKLAVDSEL